MKNRLLHIVLLFLLPLVVGCRRDFMEVDVPNPEDCLPEGVPTTVILPFYSTEQYQVEVSATKAESTSADESRIHDLYVFLFDMRDGQHQKKIYGRYFSYEHLKNSLTELDSDKNESWYVENKTVNQDPKNANRVLKTQGAVKVSTVTCSNAKLVVIANVTNAVTNMDGEDQLDRLKAVLTYDELQGINVCLEQDVVNRKDLFLMTGELNVNTSEMRWGTLPKNYSDTYKVQLKPVDAKVKFRVKVNPQYISAVTPVYWQVRNTPDRCYLDSSYDGGNEPELTNHFDSQKYYFEGTEYDYDGEGNPLTEYDPTTDSYVPITYYVFCFYMFENRQTGNGTASEYYQREIQEKIDSGTSGYKGLTGPGNESFSNHYVENGDWKYAPTFGTYVQFDFVLTLTKAGIKNIGDYIPDGVDPQSLDPEGMTIGHALTSDAIFTVHLGDFTHNGVNDYNTVRGNSYTYTVTINNTSRIYAEVMYDREEQSGQEGFLLLTDSEIINADCHYEYHQISFNYRPDMSQAKFSWYVKTPFGEGGPVVTERNGEFTYDATGLDYKWVKFGLNNIVAADHTSPDDDEDVVAWTPKNGSLIRPYTNKRHKYPGDRHYDPTWKPGQTVAVGVPVDGGPSNPLDPEYRKIPDLMDITQLIEFIFYQTRLEEAHQEDPSNPESLFLLEKTGGGIPNIRFTAFIDEYYYETDPTKPDATVDPDLWRKFVNANPRELHILSDAQSSRDRKSDVILSSHSVIQQSIQTIYNVYASKLNTLWGTEHNDEMSEKSEGWPYWPSGLAKPNTYDSGNYDTVIGRENGRLNTAYIWGFYDKRNAPFAGAKDYTDPLSSYYSSSPRHWGTYLNYDVNNATPELQNAYHGMAWSCLTRNRDNDGNGIIERDEVRWYMAAANQLVGMWVGNESLSIHARLYRPAENQWRAHVISSSGQKVSWTEEGGGATDYKYDWQLGTGWNCWPDQASASKGESVRCLRNIGTYVDGERKDITNAPYPDMVQRYFTIEANGKEEDPDISIKSKDAVGADPADTRYTFVFDFLNPKSLREYTSKDLPYHQQFHVNNCVYLKMETQSREDEQYSGDESYAYPFSKTQQEVNNIITKEGYNPYCPPGYRLPNHSELVLMSLYLPEYYYDSGWDAVNETVANYSSAYFPSRTYYDRGILGKNTERMNYDWQGLAVAAAAEQEKIGWGYSSSQGQHKTKCAKDKDKMQRTRCVRDVDMTGSIEGGILMKDVLYPGDQVPLSFSFYSSGSTFVSASLKFCYTDGESHYHERDIPIQTTPSGLQFLADQTVAIPTLASLGLTETQLDADEGKLRDKMKFRITLRNAFSSQTFDQPFHLGNPLKGDFSMTGGDVLYPGDDKGFEFDFGTDANTCILNTAKLEFYVDGDDDGEPDDVNKVISYKTALEGLPQPDSQVYEIDPAFSIGNLSMLASNLGIVGDAMGKTVKVRVTIKDAGGSSLTRVHPVVITNPLSGTFTVAGNHLLAPGGTKDINVNISSLANSCYLASATLKLKYLNSSDNPDDNTLTITPIPASSLTYILSDETISIPATGGGVGQLALLDSDLPRDAELELIITDNGGSSKSFSITEVNSKHLRISNTPTFDGFRIKATVADTRVTFNANYWDYLYYSTDEGETWTAPTSSAIVLSNIDDEIWVLGRKDNYKNVNASDDPSSNPLFSTANNKLVNIYGNIMSLLCRPASADYTHPENWTFGTTLPTDAFNGTFSKGSTAISYIDIDSSDPLVLPAYTAVRCYKGMFRKCTSLTHAPVLPATTMAESCYQAMFYDCTSLANAGSVLPDNPSITLATNCYKQMFYRSGVSTAPVLSATTLAEGCYEEMFRYCTALETAPVLPATNPENHCYYNMLRDCTNLSYVKCLIYIPGPYSKTYGTDGENNKTTRDRIFNKWLGNTKSTGRFVRASTMTFPLWSEDNFGGIPNGWTIKIDGEE